MSIQNYKCKRVKSHNVFIYPCHSIDLINEDYPSNSLNPLNLYSILYFLIQIDQFSGITFGKIMSLNDSGCYQVHTKSCSLFLLSLIYQHNPLGCPGIPESHRQGLEWILWCGPGICWHHDQYQHNSQQPFLFDGYRNTTGIHYLLLRTLMESYSGWNSSFPVFYSLNGTLLFVQIRP